MVAQAEPMSYPSPWERLRRAGSARSQGISQPLSLTHSALRQCTGLRHCIGAWSWSLRGRYPERRGETSTQFHFASGWKLRAWLVLVAFSLMASACGAGAPAVLIPGAASPSALPAVASPTPAETLDPYTSFVRNLKAAIESNDEGALRALIGIPWYAGRYKADITEYKNAADAVAGFRTIRTRITIEVDLNAAGIQPAGTQRLGERIVVARVQSGNGGEEPAFLYASLIGGSWRWVAFVTGMPAEQVSAQPTVGPTATAPASASRTPAAVSTSAPTAVPTSSVVNAHLVFSRIDSVLIRDLGESRDALLLNRPQASQWDWSKDGQHALFLMGASPQLQIWRVNRDGSGLKMLSVSGRHSSPHWSPDGTLILYGFKTTAGKDEIWLMNADGSNKHKLADGFDAAWAPEGQRIAFASNPTGTVGPAGHSLPARNGIHIINVAGKNEWAPITTDTSSPKFTSLEWQMNQARLVDSPQWSPDGNELTLRVQDGHGAYVTTSATTGGFGKFIALYFDGVARGFSYSPDGKYLTVGAGGQSGINTIAVYPRSEIGKDGVSGSPVRTLGRVPKLAGEAPQTVTAFAWSPDSARIAYAADKGGLWLLSLTDGADVQLNTDGAGPLFWLP